MKLSLVALLFLSTARPSRPTLRPTRTSRWQRHASQVNIIRDNWGIAHIYGKIRRRHGVRRHLRAGRG